MSKSPKQFLQTADLVDLRHLERLVALVWWHHHSFDRGVTLSTIKEQLKNANYPKINVTTSDRALKADNRILFCDGEYSIHAKAIASLNGVYLPLLQGSDPMPSDTLIDPELFRQSRGYIFKVINQANVAFDNRLYDCCLVMIRRLIETLIIEIYERQNKAVEIKDQSGRFLMLADLLAHFKSDHSNNIGRKSEKALEHYKSISDTAAHNRRWNAKKNDIESDIVDLRVAVDELRQMAGFG